MQQFARACACADNATGIISCLHQLMECWYRGMYPGASLNIPQVSMDVKMSNPTSAAYHKTQTTPCQSRDDIGVQKYQVRAFRVRDSPRYSHVDAHSDAARANRNHARNAPVRALPL